MSTPDPTLPLPRILCLHGAGTNARIFRNQLRALLAHPSLHSRFRFVFASGPFVCDEGIGVYPVYADWGPYHRWSRWLPTQPPVDASQAHADIARSIATATNTDEGTGAWVGVLGFSQGAKVAMSLLYAQQLAGHPGPWRFGVLMAGRAPILALTEEMEGMAWCQGAAGLPGDARVDMDEILERPEMKLRIPTVHVHGLRDEGLHLHRRCAGDYCAAGTALVVEWDGPHRVPIKRSDVDKCVAAIVEVADEYGI